MVTRMFLVLITFAFGCDSRPELVRAAWQLYDLRGSLHQTLKLVGLHPGPIPEDMPMYARPRSGEIWNVPAKVKNFPYFQHIRVAPNGTLWYNDFPRNKREPIRWYGFTRNGNRVGSIELDSSVVANQMVFPEDFGATSVLLRIEHETRGAIFRIVPITSLQSPGSDNRNCGVTAKNM